jgi:hypothetical protein
MGKIAISMAMFKFANYKWSFSMVKSVESVPKLHAVMLHALGIPGFPQDSPG